jgi:hypothetical protein
MLRTSGGLSWQGVQVFRTAETEGGQYYQTQQEHQQQQQPQRSKENKKMESKWKRNEKSEANKNFEAKLKQKIWNLLFRHEAKCKILCAPSKK